MFSVFFGVVDDDDDDEGEEEEDISLRKLTFYRFKIMNLLIYERCCI